MPQVAVALGSNLGDRQAHLAWAIERLRRVLTGLRASRTVETAPVGVPDRQPSYLNAVVVGGTDRPPEELLALLLDLERERGRERLAPAAARTLDLDLILYGDIQTARPDLVVPHPRFRERRFVLEPLVELAPDWVDPVTGWTAAGLLDDLRSKEEDVGKKEQGA